MKRDMDLFKEILKQLEEKADALSSIFPEVKGYTKDQISYHIELLDQAGYIDAEDLSDLARHYWESLL